MKLTEEQVSLFKALQDSKSGEILVQYFRDLFDEFCDIRKMDSVTPEDQRATVRLTKLIETEFLSRLSLSNPQRGIESFE